MRILVDSNIIISAGMNRFGSPARALRKILGEDSLNISEKTVTELNNFLKKKIATRYPKLREYFEGIISVSRILPTPSTPNPLESKIRDEDDQPILRAAIESGVEIIITGDRDFLESGIENPRIMTASEFLKL